MTFPFFLMAHILFGLGMGRVFERKFLSDGHILAPPLLWTLIPVTLVTAPLGMLLARYAGGWFFHGFFVGDGKIFFERFHLGIVVTVLLCAWCLTFCGLIFWPVMKSRAQERSVQWLKRGIVLMITTLLVVDHQKIFWIMGTEDKHLFNHPAGWVSIIMLATFVSWYQWIKSKYQVSMEIGQ